MAGSAGAQGDDAPTSGLRRRAAEVLEGAWSDAHRCCRPNPTTYPHRWLWDSCFHAIAWAAIGDERGTAELRTTLASRFDSGFVPHMAYHGETIRRGPRADASSLTQPPVFCHAAEVLAEAGQHVDDDLVAGCRDGLQALWDLRRDDAGMLVVLHPWEAGWDDSPRWDAWAGRRDWERGHWTRVDLELVEGLAFDDEGVARDSSAFVVASAGFNAIAAHAALALARLTGDGAWREAAGELADAIDRRCWDDEQGLWVDRVHVGPGAGGGPGPTAATPTLDGLLPALVTRDEGRGRRAVEVLRERFVRRHGVAYVATDDPTFDPDHYWRGTAWTPLDHYAALVARRWGEHGLADEVERAGRRGALASGMAEHRNPLTGAGHGAVPQTWTAAAAWTTAPGRRP